MIILCNGYPYKKISRKYILACFVGKITCLKVKIKNFAQKAAPSLTKKHNTTKPNGIQNLEIATNAPKVLFLQAKIKKDVQKNALIWPTKLTLPRNQTLIQETASIATKNLSLKRKIIFFAQKIAGKCTTSTLNHPLVT
jgi:hypothetical protein